ncbi:MAG: hypothetical protein GY854_33495 [Deltaproteobacteria bacterium]|nr:hypothetical protein [Deltaproteobacteria bacterium]
MYNSDEIANLHPPPNYEEENERLRRITGFVTTLTKEGDTRALAFARFYHVRRVVWTSRWIARRLEGGDFNVVNDLGWAHDLNRWPFAHNSEKGRYNQAGDLVRYFSSRSIDISERSLIDLRGIIDKDPNKLSIEGKIVLLSDMLTGFVEDPLWMATALDLRPDLIPPSVSEYLCLDFEGIDFPAIAAAASSFRGANSHEPFVSLFDDIFLCCMTRFLETRRPSPHAIASAEFEAKRHMIKDKFMREIIFPYNNERISKGWLLRRDLIDPLIDSLGDAATAVLTTLDEPQTVALGVERAIVDEVKRSDFLPVLDYMPRWEPESSFSRSTRSTQKEEV